MFRVYVGPLWNAEGGERHSEESLLYDVQRVGVILTIFLGTPT